jgi:hypothetical protein
VPTTRWPAASASCASARPKPLLTPVMNQVLGDEDAVVEVMAMSLEEEWKNRWPDCARAASL